MTRKETNYASHGYHKYPAKFIPQLVRRLLEEYSEEGDIILDTFGGCWTTLIESKLNGRSGICIDVNEAALLMSSAKANVSTTIIKSGLSLDALNCFMFLFNFIAFNSSKPLGVIL